LKIVQTIEPAFPAAMVQRGITQGEASLAINTGPDGRLVDLLVVSYSRPEFAEAAKSAVKQWTFEPARLDGEPVGTTVEIRFSFEAHGVIVSMSTVGDVLDAQLARIFRDGFSYQPCGARTLDKLPAPVVSVTPRYSKELAARGIKGRVRIEFYIDEDGNVRLPATTITDDSMLTALAVEAIKQWKFSPPTSRGRAVLVRASQDFEFREP